MDESVINAYVRKLSVHNAFHGLGTVMRARDEKIHKADLHLQGSPCQKCQKLNKMSNNDRKLITCARSGNNNARKENNLK